MKGPQKNDKIIFITGGAGFIGSNYLNKYVLAHPESLFVNIDSLTYAANLNNILVSKEPNYIFEKADIRDVVILEGLFVKYKPKSVIHFAAESHVDRSLVSPHLFVETNINGTHNLLYLSRKYAVSRFHQVSTDEVYGSLQKEDPKFTEKSPLAPNSPYSASKTAADLLVRSYHETFGLNAVITRCSNNYGPNQDTTKLIPLFITKLIRGEQVPLYGKGENIRDWIYVEDHIDAIDLVFRKAKSGEVYNIGGNCEMTNKELTMKLIELTGRNESFISLVPDRLGHDFRYAIDNGKIKTELQWEPKYSFEKGIEKTIEFYKRKEATVTPSVQA